MSTTDPTEFNKRLGAAVRRARTTVGMSQEAVGAVLGVTFQQVQKYERGVNRISAETLVVLAKGISTTSAKLIEAACSESAPSESAPAEEEPTRMHLEAMRAFSRLPEKLQRSTLNFVKSLVAEKAA